MSDRILAVTAPVLGAVLASTAAAWELPDYMDGCWHASGNYVVQPADPGVRPEFTRFLGIYTGRWANQLPHTLVVSEVRDDGTAVFIYAYDAYGPWGIDEAGCGRFTGRIEGAALHGELRQGITVRYEIDGDGDLLGRWSDGVNRPNYGDFDRRHSPKPNDSD